MAKASTRQDFSNVKTISVDEKSFRHGLSYLTFVIGLDARRLMFGTERRVGSTLGAFVKDLKAHGGNAEQILDACCDLSPAFIKGVQ